MGGVVGLASCVWPYARLALLLICLWAPPARLPPRRCLLLLRACDSLGKFALVDFVMLNLLTAVFKIDASLPHTTPAAAAAAPFLAITVRVSEMSFYLCFPAAIALSILISHALLALQRAATAPAPRAAAPRSNAAADAADAADADADADADTDAADAWQSHATQAAHAARDFAVHTRVAVCDFPFERLLCWRGGLPLAVRRGVLPLLLALGGLAPCSNPNHEPEPSPSLSPHPNPNPNPRPHQVGSPWSVPRCCPPSPYR